MTKKGLLSALEIIQNTWEATALKAERLLDEDDPRSCQHCLAATASVSRRNAVVIEGLIEAARMSCTQRQEAEFLMKLGMVLDEAVDEAAPDPGDTVMH